MGLPAEQRRGDALREDLDHSGVPRGGEEFVGERGQRAQHRRLRRRADRRDARGEGEARADEHVVELLPHVVADDLVALGGAVQLLPRRRAVHALRRDRHRRRRHVRESAAPAALRQHLLLLEVEHAQLIRARRQQRRGRQELQRVYEARVSAERAERRQRTAVALPDLHDRQRLPRDQLVPHRREERLVPAGHDAVEAAIVDVDGGFDLVHERHGRVEIRAVAEEAGAAAHHVDVVRRRPAASCH